VNFIIPQLADPSNAYNAQHIYVLNSLSEVQSIALITDVDRPEQLILSLFTVCFDIVSGSAKGSTGEEVTKAVEGDLTQILSQVIDESSSISPEVTDVIIAQFMRVDPGSNEQDTTRKKNANVRDGSQGNLLQKTYPRAYGMAKAICGSIPEKMTTFISQYFNNVIVDASEPTLTNGYVGKGHGSRGSLGEVDEEVKDLKELSKAHRLIRELWRACPDVLQHVIPQVEAELSAESAALRLIATETLGDVVAGIGVAGCPPSVHLDPAAYPPEDLSNPTPSLIQTNVLQAAFSPKPFAQVHTSAYESFLSRKHDRSPLIRAAWATSAGRILLTSAGGIGFAEGEEQKLQDGLAQLLADADDKVRLLAIKAIGAFGLGDVISKLASHGSISSPGSVLATLSDRVRDRKPLVRDEAMRVLGRMWATAAGEIEKGNGEAITILGEAPSKLLDSYYVNDPEVHALLDHIIFEYLLPLGYPPIKGKSLKSEGQKQASKGRSDAPLEENGADVDLIRVRRILTMVGGLDDKAKRVFFGMQKRQTQFSRVMALYLKACEDYNGGVVEENEAEIQKELTKWVEAISKTLPESTRVSADLRKFAKMHDRRNYQLIRFCLNPETEYRTAVKAIKELTKRIQGRSTNAPSLDTMTSLLYRCSLLVYNRSHVPGIMRISRSGENGLADVTQEMLKEISTHTPEVLKTHIQELCKDLESNAPSDSKSEEASASDMLKACAEFARRFPAEVPRDRKFMVAMTNYALFSRSPRAAKHAVSIIMAGSEKKEMYAKELIQKATTDCMNSSPHFLTRLATISQINLLSPKAADAESDTIIQLTMQETLLQNLQPSSDPDSYTWASSRDDETQAKEWALKCLVNFLRSHLDDEGSFKETATPVYSMLGRLIEQEGEISNLKDTPASQKSYLRLTASRFLLKLCSKGNPCEDLVTPRMFNAIGLVTQDRLSEVRAGFMAQLKKYLAQDRMNYRWYTILFLSAFEPEKSLKNDTIVWLKSRAQALARKQQAQSQSKAGHQNVMELQFARLLSLLAHHPDFPEKGSETFNSELLDFAQYIIFYLTAIGNEENLSLIFHVAQRVKQTQDAVTGTSEASDRLYVLSDLAQATIRHYADFLSHQKGHSSNINILQTWPGKLRLPLSLFAALPNHDAAQQIADKNYLAEEVAEELEKVVKATLKPSKPSSSSKHHEKKRKSETREDDGDDDDDDADEPKRAKRAKKTTLPVRKAPKSTTPKMKTPKPTRKRKSDDDVPSSEAPARKSSRKSVAQATSYAEGDSEDDDKEMERWEKLAEEKAENARSRMTDDKASQSDQDADADADAEPEPTEQPHPEPSVSPPSSPLSSPTPTKTHLNGHHLDDNEKENHDVDVDVDVDMADEAEPEPEDEDNDDNDEANPSRDASPTLLRPQLNGSSPSISKTRSSITTATTTVTATAKTAKTAKKAAPKRKVVSGGSKKTKGKKGKKEKEKEELVVSPRVSVRVLRRMRG
jgi:sister chromatid cohesion protein PDS5